MSGFHMFFMSELHVWMFTVTREQMISCSSLAQMLVTRHQLHKAEKKAAGKLNFCRKLFHQRVRKLFHQSHKQNRLGRPSSGERVAANIFCCLVLQSDHICHFFRYTFQNVRFNTKYNYCLNCSLLLLLKPAWKTFRIWVSTHKYCVDTLTELKLDFLFLQIPGDLGPKALTIQ